MKKIAYSLLLGILFTSFMFLTPFEQPSLSEDKESSLVSPEIIESPEFKASLPLAQDYETNSSDTQSSGEVLLHQAYADSTLINIDEATTSISKNAPNATDFNVSKANLQLNNIKTYNYTDSIETAVTDREQLTSALITSFSAPMNCYISNISVNIYHTDPAGATLDIILLNSTSNGSPKLLGNSTDLGDLSVSAWQDGWGTATDLNYLLDNSKTNNSIWYIGLKFKTGDAIPNWRWRTDGGNIDDTDSYQYSGGNWVLYETATTVDFTIEIGFGLDSSTATPTDIGLTINQTAVKNNPDTPTHNSGYWDHTGYGSEGGNAIEFQFDAN